MTKRQMLLAFKKGGNTRRNALRISIRKYKMLDKFWPFDTAKTRNHWPDGENCALCYYSTENGLTCKQCVLQSCDYRGDLFGCMKEALFQDDRAAFNLFRMIVLGILRAALRNLKTKKG